MDEELSHEDANIRIKINKVILETSNIDRTTKKWTDYEILQAHKMGIIYAGWLIKYIC